MQKTARWLFVQAIFTGRGSITEIHYKTNCIAMPGPVTVPAMAIFYLQLYFA